MFVIKSNFTLTKYLLERDKLISSYRNVDGEKIISTVSYFFDNNVLKKKKNKQNKIDLSSI